MTVEQGLDSALTLHRAGRLREAELIYCQILNRQPDHVDALHLLGVIAFQSGRNDLAINLMGRAVMLAPHMADFHADLGEALRTAGRLDEALAACQRAAALDPRSAVAQVNLGNVLQSMRQWERSIAAYRRSLEIIPDAPQTYNNLGSAYCNLHRMEEGIASYRRALELAPEWPEALTNLATALRDMDQVDGSMAAVTKALSIAPNYYEAHHVLGNLYKDTGRIAEAIAQYDRASTLLPGARHIDTNRAYLVHYHPDWDGPAILKCLREWNQRYTDPLKSEIRPHYNDRSPDRRLRIGYVSPNFGGHCIGRNLLPLFREQDHQKFETFYYSSLTSPDELTRRISKCGDHWRNVAGVDDRRLADIVRQDRIDILVDLTIHLAYERLQVFARKPAPVQVTFGAYPGGTGLDTIDYRLSDPYIDPPEFDGFYVERTIRLPDSFWCYDFEGMGLADTPEVNPLPATQNGYVTFGCMNNFCKVNPDVLELWRKVLDAVPGSRMLLMAPHGSLRQRISELFNHRIDFLPRQQRRPYFQGYQRVDIGLDSFPYNGHTTSLDSFWMGVPIVTLIGKTAVGRAGLCQLTHLGLTELAAKNPRQFVTIASSLAGDLPRLTRIRSSLRDHMRNSPLMDGSRFARGIENVYRSIWQEWTEKR